MVNVRWCWTRKTIERDGTDNAIGDDGATALAETLANPRELECLDLGIGASTGPASNRIDLRYLCLYEYLYFYLQRARRNDLPGVFV